jgi:hypothetical protein
MRIIGNIDHPTLKITIFKMDTRMSVKFENNLYEQTYKLSMDERFTDLQSVKDWVDATFIAEVLQQFQAMHRNRMQTIARIFPEKEEFFEEII